MMIQQDPANSNAFFVHFGQMDSDLIQLIRDWASTVKPEHCIGRADGQTKMGISNDAYLEFKHARDAMEFKLRFTAV